MPEGKLRSGVYRSFLMCDDPRGVVECKAIKKQSKTCTHNPSKPKDKSTVDDDAPPSSLQLLRVSKGIQRMNVAIESWSKGVRCDEAVVRPEDIAKSLLRGALDLEESLAMLASIQEEHKPGKDGGRRDSRFQRSMSDRFGDRIEKRMISSRDKVASRDCYEELRDVIRESFQRQNLLPQSTSLRPRTRVVGNDFASSSGAASSSSSSQSSMLSGSTKSSASSDVPRRAPNLIARLMGMDVSPQEPAKNSMNHINELDVFKSSSEKLEQLKKNKKKESAEIVRCSSTRHAVLQSFPEEIPSENPSTIVLIRPMRAVQPETEEKPGNKMPVSPKKPRMQGEVHPRMINQRKKHQPIIGENKMRLPLSVTKKDREPKDMVHKVEQNEGKVIKLMSPSSTKAVTKNQKPVETNKKPSVKKEDGEGKDRHRPHDRALKPPNATPKKLNTSSDMSRNKIRRSRLSSNSSSGEQKSTTREKKICEASGPKAKKKLHQEDNDLASENNSGSSQDTRGSLNQLSSEETKSSEFNIQGHCDNEEVSSRATTIEPETSQISLKSFLSSSPDFLSYAENLFDLENNTKRSQESALQNRDSIANSDQKLALNFAKEVARRRSLLLITKPTCPQRSSLDIDKLVMEVYDGFESLKSYRDTFLGENDFVKESIHMVLEKDLKSKRTEMTSGVWDLGWRSEFQVAETYQAVVDLEKLILSGLIQELFLS